MGEKAWTDFLSKAARASVDMTCLEILHDLKEKS